MKILAVLSARRVESRGNSYEKTITLNGVQFEVKKKGSITFYTKDLFRELTDCYNRPSDRKN